MPSDPTLAYVWVWLPGHTAPVVAGALQQTGPTTRFVYGRSYLNRREAISLYAPELPLVSGPQSPQVGDVHGCIRDAAPDSWGRRIIEHRLGLFLADPELSVLTYLLESGSDRIGALDFQDSPEHYVARDAGQATLDELVTAAEHLDRHEPLTPALDQALFHGTSIGGARPKALLEDGARRLIAKFSSSSDHYPVVKAEFVAMELARRTGLDVAPVEYVNVLGRDVLLVERFDRTPAGGRRAVVSALTVLGLDEVAGRYASYADLATAIRHNFTNADTTLHELFARITFNVLVGNNDDHARNHAAFWDGAMLTLTPAYDVCPQGRSGETSTQAMAIGGDGYRESNVFGCIERAATYHLTKGQAGTIVDAQITSIRENWDEVCDLAELTHEQRAALFEMQFLNPGAIRDERVISPSGGVAHLPVPPSVAPPSSSLR